MLARSLFIYLIAAALIASFTAEVTSNVAHAATNSNVADVAAPTKSPSPTATPSSTKTPGTTFTPLMVFRPIGRRLQAVAQPSESPLIVSVYQSGKAVSKTQSRGKSAKSRRYGNIENDKTIIGYDPNSRMGGKEGVSIDGSVEVRLLPYDIRITLPTDNYIYELQASPTKICWFSRSFKRKKSPIHLYDNAGKEYVTIGTTYPINSGDCDPNAR